MESCYHSYKRFDMKTRWKGQLLINIVKHYIEVKTIVFILLQNLQLIVHHKYVLKNIGHHARLH